MFQYLTASTCFEPLAFILRKKIANAVFVWYVYTLKLQLGVFIRYLNTKF